MSNTTKTEKVRHQRQIKFQIENPNILQHPTFWLTSYFAPLLNLFPNHKGKRLKLDKNMLRIFSIKYWQYWTVWYRNINVCKGRDKIPPAQSRFVFILNWNWIMEKKGRKGLRNIRNCLKAPSLFIHKFVLTKYLQKEKVNFYILQEMFVYYLSITPLVK